MKAKGRIQVQFLHHLLQRRRGEEVGFREEQGRIIEEGEEPPAGGREGGREGGGVE